MTYLETIERQRLALSGWLETVWLDIFNGYEATVDPIVWQV